MLWRYPAAIPLTSGAFALHPGLLKLIALLPPREFGLRSRLPTEGETEARNGRVSYEIHAGTIFVARLMIVLVGEFFRLLHAPFGAVAFVLHPFIYGERWHAHARQRKVVR